LTIGDDAYVQARRDPRWNHNIHFHRVVMDAIPAGATSALDVGTGDGLLAADLRDAIDDVTAVDIDAGVLARAAAEYSGIIWICGDVMSMELGRTFDVVASVATLHHLPDLSAAMRRLADLTAPGGVLVVVGLARSTSLRDHLTGVVGAVQHQWYARTRTVWAHSAPTVWPPPHSYREVRESAGKVLPGARWQQFPMWRYALTWNKPG
jgi:2-polyprenyl-3-methyl-5-hydroxy-6-metoxy-1,4-benzoquinol methylase